MYNGDYVDYYGDVDENYERERDEVFAGDVKLTWAGPISSPDLYGPHIQHISRQTELNLERLRTSMSCSDLYSHNKDNSKMNSMFSVSNSGAFCMKSSSSFDDNCSDISSVSSGFNFCYLCSTLEEHQKNHLHQYPKRPIKLRKPRIEYIAPKPRVKKRQLTPEAANHEALYRIVVFVGNVPSASSDANVSVIIIGTRNVLPKQRLCHGKGSKGKFCFVRGAVEKFYLKGPKLGNLQILSIEHDGLEKRHSLYIDKIEVTDMKTDLTWIFICKNWLSLHYGDYRIQRDLEAVQKERVLIEYEAEITTGKKQLGGTDANIYLTLHGKERNSQRFHLNRGKTEETFNRGHKDKFLISVRDIGEIKSLKIEHDGHGLADGWFLDKIIVRNVSNHKEIYYFLYGGWIAADEGDGKLWREIKAKKKLDKILQQGNNTRYKVTVKTGDRKFAGTDANVFIQFVGPKGSTKQLRLDDARNNFERGMLEEFEISGFDVGELSNIVIGHDNSGPGAGWFLEYVHVEKHFSPTQRKEKVEKLRNLNKSETEGDDTSKYIAMGRRQSSFNRQKALNLSDDENPGDRSRDRRKSKAEIREIFDRDGNVMRIPIYEKYLYKCGKWLAANEDDGLTQRDLVHYDKKTYYEDKNER